MRDGVTAASRVVAILGLLAVAAGCSRAERPGPSSGAVASPGPPERLVLALDSYPRPGFHADELLSLDVETFERTGESLRLRDAVTAPIGDPSESLVALGGYNFGNVILVDPFALEIRGKVDVTRRGTPEVHVVGWPAPDRLLGYAQDSAAHSALPGRGFVADPQSGELVTSVALHGSVMAATGTEQGAAFLVAPTDGVGSTRVVLIDAAGTVRHVRLRKIEAGYVAPRPPGESRSRQPALVALRDTVYVIGASEPVAAVDVRSGSVRYHRVPGLMEKVFRGSTYPATGSAGALEVLRRGAAPLGKKSLLVWGYETRAVRGGSHLRELDRLPRILDVARWHVRKTFGGLREPKLAGRTVLGRNGNDDLVASSLDGEVLYRRPGGRRMWILVGDRLVEAGVNGRAAVELDMRTGRVLAELGDVGPWITSAFEWGP